MHGATLLLLGASGTLARAAEAGAALERPSLLIVRSLAPWQEPLYPELVANDRWFCASARTFRCRHHTWLTLPPGREEYHPWFSRFHLASHALATEAEPADVVLWLDADALFFRSGVQVEAQLFGWLPEQLARTPLLLARVDESRDLAHLPKAYFAANVSAAREVLAALSELLPREDRPLEPRGTGRLLPHPYAFEGERRAQAFGSAGQLELLERRPELWRHVGMGEPGRVVAKAGGALGCALPLGAPWLAALAEARGEGEGAPLEGARPFIVHLNCGGEEPRELAHRARLFASHNAALGAQPPTAAERARGGALAAEAAAAEAGLEPAEPAPSPTPTLLLIVYGAQFALERTPVFVRSLLAARTAPLRAYVLGDPPGIAAFRGVLAQHAHGAGLALPGDSWSLFTPDGSVRLSGLLSQLPAQCHLGGYAYLFFKLLAAELLPAADHLLVADCDAVVLGDVGRLWASLRSFGPGQLLGMGPDMSHRYYYRLSDPTDEIFSTGWAAVPQRTGLNGGLMLLHLARMRAARFAEQVLAAAHAGVSLSARGELPAFCRLAEQDTVNWMVARQPAIYRPLGCAWNYMGTDVGGHQLRVLELGRAGEAGGPPLAAFYDSCPQGGPTGAYGAPGDLLRCGCGARVELLHFAGGTRRKPILAALNASILQAGAAELRRDAQLRAALPDTLDQLERALRADGRAPHAGGAGPEQPGAARAAASEVAGEQQPGGESCPAEPLPHEGLLTPGLRQTNFQQRISG